MLRAASFTTLAISILTSGCSVAPTASIPTTQAVSANDYYTAFFKPTSAAELTAQWQSLHNVRILDLYDAVVKHASDAPVSVSGVSIKNIATRLGAQRSLIKAADEQYGSYGAYLEAQGFTEAQFGAPVSVADVVAYAKSRGGSETSAGLSLVGTRAVVPVDQTLAGQDCPGSHAELGHLVPGGKVYRSGVNPDVAPVEQRIAARLTNYLNSTVGNDGEWVYPPMVFLPYDAGSGSTAESNITPADQTRSVKNLVGANDESSWLQSNSAGQGNYDYLAKPAGVMIRDSDYLKNCFKTVYTSF